MWIFDSADGTPRLLRSREGHKGTSYRIRFYGGVTITSMRDNTDRMRFLFYLFFYNYFNQPISSIIYIPFYLISY